MASRYPLHRPLPSQLPLIPLLILVGLLCVIGIVALRRARTARAKAVTLELRPSDGSGYEPGEWVTFFRNLYGIAAPAWQRWLFGEQCLTFEFHARNGDVVARCHCPERLQLVLRAHLTTAAPGLEVREVEADDALLGDAVRSRLKLWREELWPLAAPRSDCLRGVLGPLSAADSGLIQIAVQTDVGWQGRALKRLDKLAGVRSGGNPLTMALTELLDIFFGSFVHGTSAPKDAAKKTPSRPSPPPEKAREPGYRVEVRLRIAAASRGSDKGLMHAAISAFRSLDGDNGLRPKRVWLGRAFDRQMLERAAPGRGAIVLVAEELAQLFHLPCPGVALQMAPVRVLPGRTLMRHEGKVLCLSEDGAGTPVVISQPDLRHHLHLIGATGVGKSATIGNLTLQDADQNIGCGVIDPKGDLIRDLLERIPQAHSDRVVLIDPSIRDRVVGINVLDCPDPDMREVVADQVVTVFRKNFDQYWGPRSDDIMRAALLTLLRVPGATLCEVPSLLLNPEAWSDVLDDVQDPVGLEPFWDEYLRMSEGQRFQTIGPLLNKLRAFLLRPTVRNMLGQSRSTIDLQKVMDGGGILLVSLAKGLLGEETSRLLGSLLVGQIWQTALGRAERPESERPDFNLYLDEFHNYLHLPQNIDGVLVEARAYRLSLILANQHIGQLSASTREALASNARSRVVFQCGQEDARYLAREFEPRLGEQHLRNLQRFQVAVRLCVNGRTELPFTGITRPLPPPLDPETANRTRTRALERFGRSRAEVEAEIVGRLGGIGLAGESKPPAPQGATRRVKAVSKRRQRKGRAAAEAQSATNATQSVAPGESATNATPPVAPTEHDDVA